jgi:hypothetical protein
MARFEFDRFSFCLRDSMFPPLMEVAAMKHAVKPMIRERLNRQPRQDGDSGEWQDWPVADGADYEALLAELKRA